MVRHLILWKIKEEFEGAKKEEIKLGVKNGLEALIDKVPGIVKIHVQIDSLASSNADVMLDSTFESEEALKAYAVHPEHVLVADNNVRPFMEVRMCIDYEEK